MYLEADQFMHPVFREFYSERDVIIEEASLDVNDPDEQLWEALYGAAFTAHPRGRPILGWTSDIELALRTDMEAHFRKYYAPNNCQITIVGDVNAAEVFDFAAMYFGDWQSRPVDNRITVIEPEQKGIRRARVEFDAEPSLLLGFQAPVVPHPDAYVLKIITNILSMGRASRFYRSIFETQGLTMSPPWSGAPEGRDVDVLLIGAEPKSPRTAEEVERAILAELKRLKTEPVTEWELERVRNSIRMSRIQWLTSNEWLAVGIADGFALRGDWQTLFADYDRMLAVTAEDIMRVANKYFRENNLTVAELIPTTDETPPDSE
jgi:predicted Zn-dependent peptidase